MAQQLASSLKGYFTHTPNPRANQLGSMDRAYNTDVNETPQTLFRNAVNLQEPVVYLASAADMPGPMPISCIFSIDTPGGPQNTNAFYAYAGDVPSPGSTPPVIQVSHTIFEPVAPHRVNTYDTLGAAWANANNNDTHLSHPVGAGSEEVTVRHTVPIPHDYVAPILESYHNQQLSYRWLYNNVLAPMLGDPVTAAAYQNFGNWIRVASTLGAHDADPPVDVEYRGVFGVHQVISRAPGILARYLPGLMSPTNIHGTLTQMTHHQQQMVQQMQQATLAAGQPRTKSFQDVNPNLHDQVLKLCEKADISQCPSIWQRWHQVPKGAHLPLILQELGKNGATHNMIGPSLATDLATGNWVPSDPTKLNEGITFTRLNTYMTAASTQER